MVASVLEEVLFMESMETIGKFLTGKYLFYVFLCSDAENIEYDVNGISYKNFQVHNWIMNFKEKRIETL